MSPVGFFVRMRSMFDIVTDVIKGVEPGLPVLCLRVMTFYGLSRLYEDLQDRDCLKSHGFRAQHRHGYPI